MLGDDDWDFDAADMTWCQMLAATAFLVLFLSIPVTMFLVLG